LEIDTRRFPGDAPHEAGVMAVDAPGAGPTDLGEAAWAPLLPQTSVEPDARNRFEELEDIGPVTHLRLDLHPDGAVARFRAFGTAVAEEEAAD
ncbi:MAG: allantoicase, partial [Acidimicrobiia bacterium]|nr:allantoicase [Acidimicrobiia bacterium]